MKRKVLYLAQFLCYWLGIDALFYWLNRRAKRIVCFHHVLPDDLFIPHVDGFEMNETSFRACIRELKKHFRFSTDVTDSQTLTVSFDDGWRNQYTTAARVLQEEGDVPAILFVSGEMIDNADPFHSLAMELVAHWTRFVPEGAYKLTFKGEPYAIDIHSKQTRRQAGNLVQKLFREDGATHGRSLLDALDDACAFKTVLGTLSARYLEERLTGVSRRQLEDLRKRGWIVGWHSKSHFPLKLLTADDQRAELTPADEVCKEVMAYPYGSPDAVDDVTRSIVAELGYKKALSFMTEPGQPYGPHFLPRYLISANKHELHFVLSGVNHFLRYCKLLEVV